MTMLRDVHIQNVGPFRDVRCALTPLHAFIGPNATGKTLLLEHLQERLGGAGTATKSDGGEEWEPETFQQFVDVDPDSGRVSWSDGLDDGSGDWPEASAFLFESPENGLHPYLIRPVVAFLRRVTEDPVRPRQVILVTYSPLVINELRPDEVTIVTRDQATGHGRLTPISQTPHFAERSKVYALGELWLSYADGVMS